MVILMEVVVEEEDVLMETKVEEDMDIRMEVAEEGCPG